MFISTEVNRPVDSIAQRSGEDPTAAADRHLVPLLPHAPIVDPCTACGSWDVQVLGSVFPGIHIMADRRCNECGSEHLHDHRVGFAVDHPFSIDKQKKRIINETPGVGWIHGPLIESFRSPSEKDVKVERIVKRSCKQVIILNTLDFLYGHVLLKLYNALHYIDRYPQSGLIVIIPKSFEWLVPEGVAEVWSVDQRLGEAHGWYPAIDRFVQEQLLRYEEVFLGRGYAHPEFAGIDISRFTRVKPFPLEAFLQQKPHITFVAREDRLWFATPAAKFNYRAVNKLGMKKSLGRRYVKAQDRLIASTMNAIRKELPDVGFSVVGLGERGGLDAAVTDLRTRKMDERTELAWCEAYARSQIVIGVHGSNMLLPTAHAAGCIEILPYDRYGNMVQDISVRYHDRMQLFMYRFVDEFATPKAIARHAVSMFKDYDVYFRDNKVNIF